MSAGCIDVSEMYPARMAPVCDRGSVGCPVVHLRLVRRVIEREVEPAPAEHRPSDDFAGAVE